MKKLFAILLTFALLVSFAGCGDKTKKNNDDVDLQYYAKIGQIPEVEYKLSAKCDKVEKELSDKYEEYLANDPENSPDHDHDHYAEDTYFEIVDEGDYIFINGGSRFYFYQKNEKKDGISCIVTFGDAFGFKMGTFIYEIKNAMPSIEFKEETITEGMLFFDEYLSDGTVLSTEFDGVTVMFVFLNGELYATAMYKTDSWK